MGGVVAASGPPGRPSAPSAVSLKELRQAQIDLRSFPRALPGQPEASPSERLESLGPRLEALGRTLDGLVPWFQEFVGSSLLVTVARKELDEALGQVDLHVRRLHEPPSIVVPLLERSLRQLADRLEAVAVLLPGYFQLASGLQASEQPFRVRIAALPRSLRRRFYVGLVFGALFLLSTIGVILILEVPALNSGVGVSALIHKYAGTYAGIIVIALFFFAGARLILGSVWLSRSMTILPTFEGERVERAKDGIREKEREVLEPKGPREPSPSQAQGPGRAP